MALTDDNITIIPDEDVKAMMVAMMSEDLIQEPLDVILSKNAHRMAVKEAYFDLLGIPKENAFRDAVLRIEHIRGLNEALQTEDLYFKLRMVKQSKELNAPVNVSRTDANARKTAKPLKKGNAPLP